MKLCMIGVRGHNGYVLTGLESLPDVELAGACAGVEGDDLAPITDWAGQHGATPAVYEDYRRMLDDVKPDMVSIAGPYDARDVMCIEAFQRGIHVFCEKTVSITLEGLEGLRAAHASAGVHFAGMMGLRYDPAFYAAWQAVQDGAVGTVRMVSTRKSYRLGQRPDYYCCRDTYGGTIPWVGSHAIDWARWYTGKPFHAVYATHSSRYNHDLGDMEMSAMCHFTLEDETFADASVDFLRPAQAPTHGDDRVRVAGTDGVVEVMHGKATIINADGDGERELEAQCDRQIFCDFVDHVAGRQQALISPEDTFALTEACLLARQSADEGRIVTFPG